MAMTHRSTRPALVHALAVVVLLYAGTLSAADLVITNARLFAGTDAGIVEGANIAVTGDRIEAISTGAMDTRGARVIDAAGKTVMPGLIDPHVHLFFDLQGGARFPKNDAQAADWLEGPLAEMLEAYLDHGFTTILSPIDYWPEIAEARDRVESGELRSPRLLIAGGVFVAPGGHYICRSLEGAEKAWCDEHISVPMDTPEAARAGVREYAERGVDALVLDSVTNASTLQRDAIMALVNEADKHDLRILVHTSTAERLQSLVEWGIDGFVHPPGGNRDEDGSQLASAGRRGIPIAMTIGEQEELILTGQASDAVVEGYETQLHNVRQLMKAGAPIIYASDMPGAKPATTMPIVIRALSGLGMSNADILRAATRDSAEILLNQPDLGTLEPGKMADIIIINGDPLADLAALSKVETVIKAGEVVAGVGH